jgi:hypothetical protein
VVPMRLWSAPAVVDGSGRRRRRQRAGHVPPRPRRHTLVEGQVSGARVLVVDVAAGDEPPLWRWNERPASSFTYELEPQYSGPKGLEARPDRCEACDAGPRSHLSLQLLDLGLYEAACRRRSDEWCDGQVVQEGEQLIEAVRWLAAAHLTVGQLEYQADYEL